MPDEHYEGDEHESHDMKQLRAKAKRADDLEKEIAALRQDVAISDAGLTLTPAKRKALLAAHEGDVTDSEALLKTAADLGFYEPPAPAAEAPQVPAEEQAAHEQMAAATAAAEPSEAELQSIEAKVNAASSPEEVKAILASNNLLLPVQ